MEMQQVIPKFYEALNKLDITYDEDTGRLSNPIEIVIYSTNRKIKTERVLIFKDYFLVIYDDVKDTRKINFKHVKAFKSPNNIIEL